jgi:hypothetical protein
VDLKKPSRAGTRPTPLAAVASMLALAACWSSAAYSRTPNDADCDEVAKSLQSLDAASETLTLTRVDHVPIPADSSRLAAEPAAASGDHATPLLDLTPRAADALRDIFEATRETEVAQTATPEASSSPIAETEELPDISELPDNVSPVTTPGDEDIDLPLLQRQMYRIDI